MTNGLSGVFEPFRISESCGCSEFPAGLGGAGRPDPDGFLRLALRFARPEAVRSHTPMSWLLVGDASGGRRGLRSLELVLM